MSTPRQILPGSTYLVTRRCSERRRFLRPDRFVGLAYGYLLALAAKMFGLRVHCAVVLSNHHHMVVTDPSGRLPCFLAWFHRLVAVVVNCSRGRCEAFWSSSKPSVVRLETHEDVLDKMLYVFANPVAAGLVERSDDWPGFSSRPEDFLPGRELRFERPDYYFSLRGRLATGADLRLSRPPGFEDLTDEEFVALLRQRLDEHEERLRAAHHDAGRSWLGKERVLLAPWNEAPSSDEPRRVRNPHIAARNKDVRIAALGRLRVFRDTYREALRRWRAGERDVVFPAGTWAMRVCFRVCCHEPPPEPVHDD